MDVGTILSKKFLYDNLDVIREKLLFDEIYNYGAINENTMNNFNYGSLNIIEDFKEEDFHSFLKRVDVAVSLILMNNKLDQKIKAKLLVTKLNEAVISRLSFMSDVDFDNYSCLVETLNELYFAELLYSDMKYDERCKMITSELCIKFGSSYLTACENNAKWNLQEVLEMIVAREKRNKIGRALYKTRYEIVGAVELCLRFNVARTLFKFKFDVVRDSEAMNSLKCNMIIGGDNLVNFEFLQNNKKGIIYFDGEIKKLLKYDCSDNLMYVSMETDIETNNVILNVQGV
uniref:Uncharacterized protein n=2 Tax=Strongyloides stercoralis TaxID=6248 RepID=A0AAF5DIK5_STRER